MINSLQAHTKNFLGPFPGAPSPTGAHVLPPPAHGPQGCLTGRNRTRAKCRNPPPPPHSCVRPLSRSTERSRHTEARWGGTEVTPWRPGTPVRGVQSRVGEKAEGPQSPWRRPPGRRRRESRVFRSLRASFPWVVHKHRLQPHRGPQSSLSVFPGSLTSSSAPCYLGRDVLQFGSTLETGR